jgi:hypothetical protein
MAYEGYRIKVNGNVIPNALIAKGSYKFKKISRVIASYYDAAGYLHEEKSPRERTSITFAIRERNRAEHESIIGAFLKRENVVVVYWDEESGIYREAICKIGDIDISHLNTIGGDINYAEMPISIEEY